MREVTIYWRRARLVNSNVSEVIQVCSFIEFLGYIERTASKVTIVCRVIFNEGYQPEDMDSISFLSVEDILLEPVGDEKEWLLLIRLSHPITNLNARTGRTHAVPGSRLDNEGLHYVLRGSPLSLKILVAGARMMFKPDRISARNLVPKEAMKTGILTPQQLRIAKQAFDDGWYDIPKGTTMTDLAKVLDMARSTVSEHLARIESALMYDIFGSFSAPIMTAEQEAMLRESVFGGREPADEIQVELDRILAISSSDDE